MGFSSNRLLNSSASYDLKTINNKTQKTSLPKDNAETTMVNIGYVAFKEKLGLTIY